MSQVLFDLTDKTAIITGGGSGIGAGIARAYGALGANLVIADVEMETAEEVAAELEAAGYPVLLLKVDVRSKDQVEAMVERAMDRGFKWIDLSITSADNPATPVLAERLGGTVYKRWRVYRYEF